MRLLVIVALVAASCPPGPGAGMVQVPAAVFVMGCLPSDTQCAPDEKPAHEVSLPAFALDFRKVSQRDFAACVSAGVCAAPPVFDPEAHPDAPVRSLKWEDAVQYCGWVDKRLPTEAEHELAARALDGRLYPWGAAAPDCDHATFAAAPGPCSAGDPTTPVDGRPLGYGPYGNADLSGNVWEWVSDWYAADFYSTSPRERPLGPATGTAHVIRGGSFRSPAAALRTSARGSHGAGGADDIGFRCARDA